jgi:DNA-binding transcriptional MocR family regulator
MFISSKPDNGPMHMQLRQQIQELISAGSLPAGSRLPSSRVLAGLLGVSRNTVLTVYESLVADGVLEARGRTGTFVASAQGGRAYRVSSTGQADGAESTVDWGNMLSDSARMIADLPPRSRAPQAGTPGVILSRLVPWWDQRSAERMRMCINYVLQRDHTVLLDYGPTEGYQPLREWVATYMGKKGVSAEPGEVLIVSGFQQGMDVICRTLLNPGDVVFTQDPTYVGAVACLRAAGVRIRGIPVTSAGLDLESLAALAQQERPKMVYVMPAFQNPTGVTMDLATRLKLLEYADRFDFVVVEDGFSDELCHPGSFIPPLKAHDRSGRVLHVNSMSKLLFPGLRIGWVVAPRHAVAALAAAKRTADLNCSPILQAALHEFCRLGYCRLHLARARRIYQTRRKAMVSALEQYFPPSVEWYAGEGGLAAWVTLPPGVDSVHLYEEAARAGVWICPGVDYFVHGGGERNLRLVWCSATPREIDAGVRILGELLRSHLEGKCCA